MGIYKYDFEDLSDTASGLARLRSDFANASSVKEEAADSFGYGDLIGAVEEFVDNWSANREKQLETLESAKTALDDIVENYRSLDADGVAELEDSGS
jgi:hypothetical protein